MTVSVQENWKKKKKKLFVLIIQWLASGINKQ